MKKIPVCEPFLAGHELEYVTEAVRSGWISSGGKFLQEFERKFGDYCGVKHGVATTSGTTALHLALRALGVQAGDEVIIPDFTMAAVLFSVLYCGAKPVFIDADAETWNMDADQIESKISPKTKAIIAVHTYGHPCDMDPIVALARKYHLKVVEDAAEAHGALYKGRRSGSLADVACFSFYANKIITTGEGGMVLTDDGGLADRCRYFRNLCFSLHGPRDFMHEDVGFNYRMTNVQAAIGLAQLENIEDLIARRRENARRYNTGLADVAGLQRPAEKEYAKNVYWMYGLVVRPEVLGISRDALGAKLAERGIETRSFFKPMHRQKMIVEKYAPAKAGYFPTAEALAENGLYLPSGPALSSENSAAICDAIREVAKIRVY